MRFLADMRVSQQVVYWLHGNGHDAVHLRDEGLQRLPNGRFSRRQQASSAAQRTAGYGRVGEPERPTAPVSPLRVTKGKSYKRDASSL